MNYNKSYSTITTLNNVNVTLLVYVSCGLLQSFIVKGRGEFLKYFFKKNIFMFMNQNTFFLVFSLTLKILVSSLIKGFYANNDLELC